MYHPSSGRDGFGAVKPPRRLWHHVGQEEEEVEEQGFDYSKLETLNFETLSFEEADDLLVEMMDELATLKNRYAALYN